MTISQKSLIPYLEQRHTMGHLNSLLARFPISGCAYFSSQLERRRWQKQYCSCHGDWYVCRCHSRRSTSTRAWGVHSACGHLGPHGDCRCSCCLSKSKIKNKSAKEILNKNDSFFWKNCPSSTKRTGHYAWPRCSFSWSDCACNHPSCHRTLGSSSPCRCAEGNCGWFGECPGCVGCFDGSRNIYNYDAAGSLIHSYVQQEDEPFSFPLAASYPWQSSWDRQPPFWLLDTAQRKGSSWVGQ